MKSLKLVLSVFIFSIAMASCTKENVEELDKKEILKLGNCVMDEGDNPVPPNEGTYSLPTDSTYVNNY